MKRDLDLIRLILLAIEADALYRTGRHGHFRLSIPGYHDDNVQYHLALLHEAGFLVAQVMNYDYFVTRLTWDGHEFLDTIRNDSIWNRAKGKALETTGGLGLSVLRDLAVLYARQAAGL